MTINNRNFILAYILLVALPVFGLVGILRSGRNLAAPMSLSGTWKISADLDQLSASPCTKLFAGANTAFSISQSGTMFVLNFPNSGMPSVSGKIDGSTITADLASASAAKDPACSLQPVSLTASVDDKTTPHSMRGVVRVQNCSSCGPVEFRAIRDEQLKAKETR